MMNPTPEKYEIYSKIVMMIDSKLREIRKDTAHHSNPHFTLEHEDFKELVKMGPKIIPYIMHRMLQKGSDWTYFLLIKEILGEDAIQIPEDHRGRIGLMTSDYILWYEKSKYRTDDIYHGLVEGEPQPQSKSTKAKRGPPGRVSGQS